MDHAELDEGRRRFPRLLTDREASVLRFMLSPDDPRLAPLRAQAEALVVSGMCECGCAWIDFEVDREGTTAAMGLSRPAVEAHMNVAHDPVSVLGLLLWADDGWLSGLEVYFVGAVPAEFPPPEEFRSPEVNR